MPSLHKFFKLRGSFRASAHAEGQGKGRLVFFRPSKSEKSAGWQRAKQGPVVQPKAGGGRTPPARPSFVNSFASSFTSGASASSRPTSFSYSASTLNLKNSKKDQGLTAAAAISRVVSTPSINSQFRQSSQILIECHDSDKNRDLAGKGLLVGQGRTAKEVIGRLKDAFTGDVADRSTTRKVDRRFSTYALVSPNQELWKEQRCRDQACECTEKSLGKVLFSEIKAGSDKLEGVVRSSELCRDSEADANGTFGSSTGCVRAESSPDSVRMTSGSTQEGLFGSIKLSSLIGASLGSTFQNGSSMLLRFGEKFLRALHDVSLAGESFTVERLSDRENSERLSDHTTSKDGESLTLLSGACNLPHPDKVKTGGEDAFFICPDKKVVGVADGVGGWADLGIDAGEYARELMSQAVVAVSEEPIGAVDPVRVLAKAHAKTKCRGSSTACILALSDTVLEAANLGDSGFLILRNSRTVFKSPVQQHQFNIPYQLESEGSDPPSAAQVFSIEVAVGDVIVAGTDGLFDNLYDNELTTVVVQALRSGMGPQTTAQNVANLAKTRALDRNRQTPFSTAAQDAGYRFYGGKMDDITVIVSYITSSKSSTNAP